MVRIAVILAVLLVGCGPSLPEKVGIAYDKLPRKLDYNIHVKPILSDKCFACHGNDKNKLMAGLRLDNEVDAYKALKDKPDMYAVVPGKLGRSELYHRIVSEDAETIMPPPESNLVLKAEEKAVLAKWIEQGAEYKDHWAFLAPAEVKVRKLTGKDWVRNEIDEYVLAKLEAKEWSPSPAADNSDLLRRVSLDLTGLPPSLETIQSFSDENYESVVDELLGSRAYGERMAVEWMDLSRFADTHGYTVDRYRDMSPWRDWVIKALNENVPYNDFVTWQLAGDLMPNASKEQILATGFNRNHQQNMEGGIIAEEYRVEYVADRANTFGTAFLGLTVECARCHDHKYDPISQKEYFELFSFFNNVNEAGQISWNDATPVPTLLMTDEKLDKVVKFIDEQISEIAENKDLPGFNEWLAGNPVINKDINKPIAHLAFDGTLGIGQLKQQYSSKEPLPDFSGGGILLNGDSWVDIGRIGATNKDQEFSVSVRIKLPPDLKNGVIFHKGDGAALYNFRGFHLSIKDDKLEALVAHTAPDNAIIKRGGNVPREEWIELTMTYDGSSKASGLKVYLDGNQYDMNTEVDNLSKDIIFGLEEEKGVQIGARWRGVGIKGAIIDDFKLYDVALSTLVVGGGNKGTRDEMLEYYARNIDPNRKERKEKLYRVRRNRTEALDTVPEMMVMKEMDEPRQAYILERGLYDNYGEEVFPNTIAAVLPFTEEFPKNRLGLAQWLFDERNPLTARVAVNRIWQQLFGRGLVKSANDFGNQGDMPSHLELLDHLAISFMESGWDQKALIKKIVMSATYRQSSVLREEMVAVDSDNVFLWRGPVSRLSAEMMRDNALAASGLLVSKVGGPSVKPYQPKGLWAINGGRYERDYGENLYRRSLYTFWKRTVPNPTQAIFDAPSRSACTVSRQKTSTPLQALVLMNDPAFLETAKVMAEQISRTENIELAISNAFAKLSGRVPTDNELKVLLQLRQEEFEKFSREPAKMQGWLEAGDYAVNTKVASAELAANTVIASTIINADATIIKR